MDFSFTIDGKQLPFNELWVHLKENDKSLNLYHLHVPSDYLSFVFDPHGELRAEYTSYRNCILNTIEVLGTAALDAYVEQISKLNEEEKSDGRSWVLTSLDNVEEVENGVTLSGRAEPFEGNQFEFRSL